MNQNYAIKKYEIALILFYLVFEKKLCTLLFSFCIKFKQFGRFMKDFGEIALTAGNKTLFFQLKRNNWIELYYISNKDLVIEIY